MVQGEIPFYLYDKSGDLVGINPDYPHHGRCKAGHTIKNVGVGVRFFSVSGAVVSDAVKGIYCEFCLSIANRIAGLAKRRR